MNISKHLYFEKHFKNHNSYHLMIKLHYIVLYLKTNKAIKLTALVCIDCTDL